MGHRSGESRQQAALFPVMLDELVDEQALVRVVDAWVDTLDMKKLGFAKANAQVMGRPPYDPADLFKMYLWGYLNVVRSSRSLERECRRNVECMWLMGRLAPDHKTIAEFRRQNSQSLVATAAAFVQFARNRGLIGGTTVAIDGSKIRAVASRKAVATASQLRDQAERTAQEISHYLAQLDELDSQEVGSDARAEDIKAALADLKRKEAVVVQELDALGQSRRTTVVQSEPQAQVMRSLHGAPGYNLQTAVETTSHLIVAHDVNAEASDQRQLQPMAQAAKAALDKPCTVVADAGYANGQQIAALDEQGIQSFVAVNRAVNNQGGGGLYDRTAFSYDASSDSFTCPAGQLLKRKQVSNTDNMVVYAARREDCAVCPNKPQCTKAAQRFVTRHLYEDALQANARRVDEQPEMMALRRQTVEHPYGTIKHHILGNARLLMRGIKGAQTELSLAVLAYNLKRAINMKGATWMRQELQG